MRKSVFASQPAYKGFIPHNATCYRCGTTRGLHRHHIFAGSLRSISEREGLWVYLCEDCHEGPIRGIHAKRKMHGHTCTDDEHLRWHAQQMWECRRVNEGMTWDEARTAWRSLAKSGMPSYSYVQDDGHGMWIHDWK